MTTEIPTADGLYENIDEAAYHADRTSISQSGVKLLLKAPALYKHQLDNPPPFKRIFELGSAAHTVVLGEGAKMAAIHRFDPKTKEDLGEAEDMKTPSSRAHAAEIRAAGQIPLLRKEITQVEDMAESLARHKQAMDILSVGKPEVTGYALDEPTSLRRRIRIDWLHPQVLGDLKTADSADPDVFARKSVDLGYPIQAAMYSDVARELGHPAKVFAFCLIEKHPPYLCSVVILGPRSIKWGRKKYRQGLEILRDCLAVDKWPGYIDDDTYATRELPDYAFFERNADA